MGETKRAVLNRTFVIYIIIAILFIAASVWLFNFGIGKYREGINHSMYLTMIYVGCVMGFVIGSFSLAMVFIADAIRKYRELAEEQKEE